MATSKPKRFLLAQRACVEGYPPTLNQAAILSETARVVVLDALTEVENTLLLTPPSVRRVRIWRKQAQAPVQVLVRALGLAHRLNWLRRFYSEFARQLRARPTAAIAYDPEAAFWLLLGRRRGRTLRIVHLHEMTVPEDVAASPVARLGLASTLKNLHRADLVVMPDRHRAEYVREAAGLKKTPLVVMNCPRLLSELPASLLMPFLRARGISTNHIVHYQGAVGPGHYFESIILSMRWWPLDSVFTIVGAVESEYRQQLSQVAEKEGVRDRLVFVGRVPYDQVFAYAVGASVGVNFLNGKYLQFHLSAGASNKRFEYAALGIPQVTNDLPGVRELFEQPGLAAIADADDVADIGAKIARYLEDEPGRAEAGARARRMHLEEYNYERQMQPLLQEIERQVQGRGWNLIGGRR